MCALCCVARVCLDAPSQQEAVRGRGGLTAASSTSKPQTSSGSLGGHFTIPTAGLLPVWLSLNQHHG